MIFESARTGRFSATFAVLIVLFASFSADAASRTIGEARKVAGDVQRVTVNQPARSGDALIYAETILTDTASAIDIRLIDDTTLAIGEDSELTLDSLVYDPNRNIVEGVATVLTGVIHFASAQAKMDFTIRTPTATIGVRGTAFDVLADRHATEVAVRSGTVEVTSGAGKARVSAGQVYRTDGRNGSYTDTPSTRLESNLARMNTLLSGTQVAPQQKAESTFLRDEEAAQSASTPKQSVSYSLSSVENVLQGRDKENASLVQTSKGIVVIELRPDLAPRHVARIKELIRAGFYDGQKFTFVRSGYVAEVGSVRETGQSLPAEISRTPVVRGSVGMSRQTNDPNSADARFFIALGRAAAFDGKYTVWGRVIQGMRALDRLAAGKPPSKPDRIITLRIAADVMDD